MLSLLSGCHTSITISWVYIPSCSIPCFRLMKLVNVFKVSFFTPLSFHFFDSSNFRPSLQLWFVCFAEGIAEKQKSRGKQMLQINITWLKFPTGRSFFVFSRTEKNREERSEFSWIYALFGKKTISNRFLNSECFWQFWFSCENWFLVSKLRPLFKYYRS